MTDFSRCEVSHRSYGGSDTKLSIVIDGQFYMVKKGDVLSFDERNPLKASVSGSPFSEHIGCCIIKTMGLPVQETLIGRWGDGFAVACKDFMDNDPRLSDGHWQLQEFSTLEVNMFSSSQRGRTPSLENIEQVFAGHPRLAPIQREAVERYWDMMVADALIGNFDRHAGNWGYITNKDTGEIRTAPIYDCGATLYPKIRDEMMPGLLANAAEVDARVFTYPTAALMVGGKRIGYHELLQSGHPECDKAVLRVFPKIDVAKAIGIVAETPGLSPERREFLQFMLGKRYEKILVPSFAKARERLADKGRGRALERQGLEGRQAGLSGRLAGAEAASRLQQPRSCGPRPGRDGR
jgi:hypothetical protein